MIPAPGRYPRAQRHQQQRQQEPQQDQQRSSRLRPRLAADGIAGAGATTATANLSLPSGAYGGRDRRLRRLTRAAAAAASTIMLALQLQLRLCTALVAPPLATTARLQKASSAMAGARRCGGGIGGQGPAPTARRFSPQLQFLATRAGAGGAATDANALQPRSRSRSPGEETETGCTGPRGAVGESRRYGWCS